MLKWAWLQLCACRSRALLLSETRTSRRAENYQPYVLSERKKKLAKTGHTKAQTRQNTTASPTVKDKRNEDVDDSAHNNDQEDTEEAIKKW